MEILHSGRFDSMAVQNGLWLPTMVEKPTLIFWQEASSANGRNSLRATIYKATALVFCAFLFQTSHAQTFPFEVEQYFAYFKIPDKRQGGLQIFSPYIFLSKEKCIAQGVENKDAKQSIAYWPAGQIQQNCWADYGANITTCPIAGKEKTGKLGNACIDIGKSRFLDISNIPKSAKF